MDCHGLTTTGFIETRWAKRWRNTNMSHMSVKGCLSISMRSSAAPEKPGSPMTASAFSERRRRSLARCKLLCLKGARKAGGWAMGAMGGCRWFEELLRFAKTESIDLWIYSHKYKRRIPNTVCLLVFNIVFMECREAVNDPRLAWTK